MIRRTVILSLRPPGPSETWPKDFNAWEKHVRDRIPKRFHYYDDYRADFSDQHFDEFVTALEALAKEKIAQQHKRGPCSITERLEEAGKTQIEWFVLDPANYIEKYDFDPLGICSIKGTDQKRGVNVLTGGTSGGDLRQRPIPEVCRTTRMGRRIIRAVVGRWQVCCRYLASGMVGPSVGTRISPTTVQLGYLSSRSRKIAGLVSLWRIVF